jgi:hypothetical protein
MTTTKTETTAPDLSGRVWAAWAFKHEAEERYQSVCQDCQNPKPFDEED